MGVYALVAALTAQDRNRTANVFPLVLGPHGSNFGYVIKAMGPRLADLDGGIRMSIKGEEISACVFPMAYIGDMPQQQENSGFQSQNARLGCPFCTVTDTERGYLNFDIVHHGRYRHEVTRIRSWIAATTGVTAKANLAHKFGMKSNHVLPCRQYHQRSTSSLADLVILPTPNSVASRSSPILYS